MQKENNVKHSSGGAVASGHHLTSLAACEMLNKGGNAFDAVLAAAFAATVAEPCLISLGGGGFLLAHRVGNRDNVLYDFFVNSPGQGIDVPESPELEAVNIEFISSSQIFHVGNASVAVPGMLRGLIRCYEDLCTMDIEDLMAPALRYLRDGVEINSLQQYLIQMLLPILVRSPYGKEIYAGKERGGTFYNPLLREFFRVCSPECWMDALYGEKSEDLERQLAPGGGMLTARDLREYEVIRREPLSIMYRGYEILTNPPPSSGGSLLLMALSHMGGQPPCSGPGPKGALLLAEMMGLMNRHRKGTTGTTHISVIDGKGNAASLTASNGSNSGIFAGETGIMLNNMMGEDDLHPDGFHLMPPGERVGSMMSPTIIQKDSQIFAVLGSGGSKRIRTAMLQVIHNLIDRNMPIGEAVEAPRIHLDDDGVLQMEPGLSNDVVKALKGMYPTNLWEGQDLYFGGVHTVMGHLDGCGDSRRGGAYIRI